MMTQTASTVRSAAFVPAPMAAVAVFLLGPVLTVWAISQYASSSGIALPTDVSLIAVTAVVALWSPLAVSIPALWMQTARDGALRPMRRGLFPRVLRGVLLVPHLLSGPRTAGPVAANVAGFVAGVGFALSI